MSDQTCLTAKPLCPISGSEMKPWLFVPGLVVRPIYPARILILKLGSYSCKLYLLLMRKNMIAFALLLKNQGFSPIYNKCNK